MVVLAQKTTVVRHLATRLQGCAHSAISSELVSDALPGYLGKGKKQKRNSKFRRFLKVATAQGSKNWRFISRLLHRPLVTTLKEFKLQIAMRLCLLMKSILIPPKVHPSWRMVNCKYNHHIEMRADLSVINSGMKQHESGMGMVAIFRETSVRNIMPKVFFLPERNHPQVPYRGFWLRRCWHKQFNSFIYFIAWSLHFCTQKAAIRTFVLLAPQPHITQMWQNMNLQDSYHNGHLSKCA